MNSVLFVRGVRNSSSAGSKNQSDAARGPLFALEISVSARGKPTGASAADQGSAPPMWSVPSAGAFAHGAQVDSQGLAFFVEMTSFETESAGGVGHALVIAFQLREDLFALEGVCA